MHKRLGIVGLCFAYWITCSVLMYNWLISGSRFTGDMVICLIAAPFFGLIFGFLIPLLLAVLGYIAYFFGTGVVNWVKTGDFDIGIH